MLAQPEAPTITLPFPWNQGEHMAVIGDTGTGKTYLTSRLLLMRTYSLSLKSKADSTRLPGKLIRRAKDIDDVRHERFVLEPPYEEQRTEFARALERVWISGGWCVNLDELFALTQMKLTPFIDRILTQGRSKHLTVVAGMQRPVGVTRYAISQATHVLCAYQEGRDLKTVVEATSPRFAPILSTLDQYEFGWYYRPKRLFWRGRAQDLFKVGEEESE